MEKEDFIELTTKIYHLTLLFPKKEPLRYKIREAADEILPNLVTWKILISSGPKEVSDEKKEKIKELISSIKTDLEIINSYFEVVKWQNWVSYFEISEIQAEYAKIGGEIETTKQFLEEKTAPLPFIKDNREDRMNSGVKAENIAGPNQIKKENFKKFPNERQQKILEVLKEKGTAQVWELKQVFPEVTKRTLRRDFEQLLTKGFVERIGERNDTFYKLKAIV